MPQPTASTTDAQPELGTDGGSHTRTVGTRVKLVAPGSVLFRQGDPPGPMYIVQSGTLRVLRVSESGSPRELARITRGGVVGELASILNQPRSATVEALASSELIELTPADMRALAAHSKTFARTIVATVASRTRDAGVRGDSGRERDLTTAETGAGTVRERRTAAVLRPPEHDAKRTLLRPTVCPVCSTGFSAIHLRPTQDVPVATESDLHRVYRTAATPYDYAVTVCPTCLFAAVANEFEAPLTDDQRAQVANAVARVVRDRWQGERPEFNVDRTPDLRQSSLELALEQYRARGASAQRLASLQHQLAWSARDQGKDDLERDWLEIALASYKAALDSISDDSLSEELRLTYLCGELALRLGAPDEAQAWFWHVVRYPNTPKRGTWQRMARTGWEHARQRAEAGGTVRAA